eukprot:3937914-Rhodomonas_salina.5
MLASEVRQSQGQVAAAAAVQVAAALGPARGVGNGIPAGAFPAAAPALGFWMTSGRARLGTFSKG